MPSISPLSVADLADVASTAAATYALFPNPSPLDALLDVNGGADFTQAQAQAFAERYRVIGQQDNTATGFSATLFSDRRNAGQVVLAIRGTETEGDAVNDLLRTDLRDIGLHGYACAQAVDLYRYWRQCTTPPGRTVTYSAAERLMLFELSLGPTRGRAVMELGSSREAVLASDQWRAWLTAFEAELATDVGARSTDPSRPLIDPAQQLVVTGHSLGGHLALIFDRLFPANVSRVVTINAPTLSTDASRYLSELGLRAGDPGHILRIEADGDAIHRIGSARPGEVLSIAQEDYGPEAGLSRNHGSSNSVDALNVMAMLGSLDRTLDTDIERASSLLRAAADTGDLTFENTVDAVRRTLFGPGVRATPVATNSDRAARTPLYENLAALRRFAQDERLLGTMSIQLTPAEVATESATRFASLVTLLALSPLQLRGRDAAADLVLGGVVSRAWSSEYALWQADRRLTEVERNLGRASFSAAWCSDRAEMLAWSIRLNQRDERELEWPGGAQNTRYTDAASGLGFNVIGTHALGRRHVRFGDAADNTLTGGSRADRLYGGGGFDVLNAGGGQDRLEGNDGDDALYGEDGADGLYGGSGDDLLTGGRGNDNLYGGDGSDRYVIATGDGADTLADADGRGSVLLGGVLLTGASGSQGTVYLDPARNLSYTLVGDMAAPDGATLLVSGPTGQLRIERFHNGDLGITLGTGAPVVADTSLTSAANYAFAPTGVVIDGLDGGDLLIGSSQAQHLIGGNGNDILLGRRGDDTIDGGAGNDFLNGGAGRDVIYGGSGNDVIVGQSYVDAVIAAASAGQTSWQRVAASWTWQYDSGVAGARLVFDPATGDLDARWRLLSGADGLGLVQPGLSSSEADISAPDTLRAGDGNDIASGGNGDDHLSGDAGDDVLEGNLGQDEMAGGLGNDEMSGGAGDDDLDGGAGMDTMYGGDGADRLLGGTEADRLYGDWPRVEAGSGTAPGATAARLGDDFIDAGAGNDLAWGGGGHDVLIGGDGNDTLEGDGLDTPVASRGDDWLQGGTGQDVLVGNAGDDRLEGGTGDDRLLGDAATSSTQTSIDGHDELAGGEGNDLLAGQGGDDRLDGGAGNDQLDAGNGNDLLEGGSGDDALFGGSGDDVLIGGAGRDSLDGGAGDDRYVFDERDLVAGGGERIADASGHNTLQIAGTVTLASQQTDGALLLSFGRSSTSRGVVVQAAFTNAVETLVVNGRSETLRDWLQTHLLTTVNATATASGQLVFGGGGNDNLVAGVGNTTLDGGRGDDTLTLASGAGDGTTVRLALGDGSDRLIGAVSAATEATRQRTVLQMGDGIDGASLRFVVEHGGSITGRYLYYGDRGDRIAISGLHSNPDARGFDQVRLADGTVLSWNALLARGIDHVAGGATVQHGTHADDRITGSAGDDTLSGSLGNDVLRGGRGNDALNGGGGRNVYRIDRGDGRDNIVMTAGADDTIAFGAGIDATDLVWSRYVSMLVIRVRGSDQRIQIHDDSGRIPVNRYTFADGTVLAAADVSLTPGQQQATSGADEIIGLPSGDRIAAGSGDDTVTSWRGVDVLNGGDGDDRLSAGGGNDVLAGDAGNDLLEGEDGDDVLAGGTGSDFLSGGSGSDTYLFGRGDQSDQIAEVGSSGERDVIALGADIGPDDVQLLRTDNGRWILALRNSDDGIRFGNSDPISGAARTDIEAVRFADGTVWELADLRRLSLIGGAASDILEGFETDDAMEGGAGDDLLEGRDGNDVLTGGRGDDTLAGNAGDDTIRYRLGDGFDDIVEADLDEPGTDTLAFGPGITPDMVWFERSDGTLDLMLPEIDGRVTIGGYFGPRSTIDRISFADGTVWTVDMLRSRLYTGSAGIDRLLGDDIANTLDGGEGDDVLVGLEGDDLLRGGSGHDELDGQTGNDTLDGGDGRDRLLGGEGDDTYRFGYGRGVDEVGEGPGRGMDRVLLDAGIALAEVRFLRTNGSPSRAILEPRYEVSTASDSLVLQLRDGSELWLCAYFGSGPTAGGATGERYERIEFADGTVLTRADVLRLVGAPATVDALVGTAADDVHTVDHAGDTISEAAGGGVDLVRSSVWYAMPSQVENIELTGTAAIGAIGTLGDNVMTGNAGDNWLDNGGGGDDLLRGGAGNDVYRLIDRMRRVLDIREALAPVPGQVIERAGEGIDEIITNSLQFTLPDNIENLTVESARVSYVNRISDGSSEVELRYAGNRLDNRIDLGHVPLSGDGELPEVFVSDTGTRPTRVVLDGGSGADTMIGSALNDTYIVDDIGDRVIETAYYHDVYQTQMSNADRVRSSVDWTLGDHVEALELTGSAAIDGTGNRLDNRLVGNAAANRLAGGGGHDRYDGGAGNDRLVDDSTRSDDRYSWGAGDGIDTLSDAGGSDDRVMIDEGVQADQLWWRRRGDDLELSVIGTGDRLTVEGWYDGATHRIESFRLAGGETLQSSQVQSLVDAMAGFAPPAAGQTSLPASYANTLQPLIAAQWH